MTPSKVFGSLLTVTTGAVFALLLGCGGDSKPANSPSGESSTSGKEVSYQAPELAVQTLNDKGKIDLSGMQGKIIVVDFWATWCGPCKQSFPKLEAMSKKVSDKVVILGVSVDDEKKGVAEFAKENGASFAIGWDEGHSIANRWKVDKMPTTFIVDATGKVRRIHDGYHDGETDSMEKELSALVTEAASAPPPDASKAKDDATAKTGDDTKKDDTKKDDTKKDDAATKSDDAASGDDATPKKKPKGKGKGKGKKPKKAKAKSAP